MRKIASFAILAALVAAAGPARAQDTPSMYHDDWIDFNKNGQMDPYENPELTVAERVEDLVERMTLDEKTMQTVTLYGYGDVLEDALPQPGWTDELWKDGLANIDEQHTYVGDTEYAYPYPKHARAINETQRWFVEETRLGIPVDFTNEGIRGLAHYRATSFPAQIGQASTWNVDLIHEIGRITGRVVAEALFEAFSPCGKLPITFPRTVGQIPFNSAHERDLQAGEARWVVVRTRVNNALYPFGHGLSYTTFAYDDLRVTPEQMPGSGTATVSFDVTNTGERAGGILTMPIKTLAQASRWPKTSR